jgi:hypothetical protein
MQLRPLVRPKPLWPRLQRHAGRWTKLTREKKTPANVLQMQLTTTALERQEQNTMLSRLLFTDWFLCRKMKLCDIIFAEHSNLTCLHRALLECRFLRLVNLTKLHLHGFTCCVPAHLHLHMLLCANLATCQFHATYSWSRIASFCFLSLGPTKSYIRWISGHRKC